MFHFSYTIYDCAATHAGTASLYNWKRQQKLLYVHVSYSADRACSFQHFRTSQEGATAFAYNGNKWNKVNHGIHFSLATMSVFKLESAEVFAQAETRREKGQRSQLGWSKC